MSLWITASLAVVVIAGVTGGVTAWRSLNPPIDGVAEETADPPSETPAAGKAAADAPADRLPGQWLPNDTRLLFSVKLASVAGATKTDAAAPWAEAFWQATTGRILKTFDLEPSAVRRLTWASTNLAAWQEQAVAILELEDKSSGEARCNLGEAMPLQIAGVECRHLPQGAWPHPFAILDDGVVITGPEALLRDLAKRTEPRWASPAIGRLLKTSAAGQDVLALVDLAAAREAGWQLPVALTDVWPQGRVPCRMAWESPQGIGFFLRHAERLQTEVAFVCDGDSSAQGVHDALVKRLLPAGRQAIEDLTVSLAKASQGKQSGESASPYESLLRIAKNALASPRCEIAEQTVWLRIEWSDDLAKTLAAVAGSVEAMRTDWQKAAEGAGDANVRRLAKALDDYRKQTQHFPVGAGGGALLPAESRLSWIAATLPFLGHADWGEQLQSGYPWNDPTNRPVTRRPLPEVVNPRIGTRTTEVGFPVTHYVGVAGVGEKAAEVKPGEPGAGLFGYSRMPREKDVPDGTSNTIAVLGVTQRLGPWAQGGDATVRALTRRPYVNGPDGFGSGQPNGMLAGMADGSVRFLSKNVDPAVLEQLATVAGGEKVDMSTLDPAQSPKPAEAKVAVADPPQPKVAPPKEPREVPEPKQETDEAAVNEKVDVKARLADRLAGLRLQGMPLADAVRLVSRMSTVQVTLDLDAMALLGVTPRSPVTIELSGVTVKQALDRIADNRGLQCVVEENQVALTCPEAKRTKLQTVSYNAADLIGTSATVGPELVQWIPKFVAPETWHPAGGRGTIRLSGRELVVGQTELVQIQVRQFLERLRSARGLAPQGPDKVSLATRFDLARAKLRQPVTANFLDKAPLAEILGELEKASKSTILVDWSSVQSSGISPASEGTLRSSNQRLSEALMSLLQPLGLSYRIVGGDMFEVTSRKLFNSRQELEFYPIAPLLAKGQTPEGLIERIKERVAGATWSDAGGPGIIYFDRSSQCLLVLQSQPVQVKLELLLAEVATELGITPRAAGAGKSRRR